MLDQLAGIPMSKQYRLKIWHANDITLHSKIMTITDAAILLYSCHHAIIQRFEVWKYLASEEQLRKSDAYETIVVYKWDRKLDNMDKYYSFGEKMHNTMRLMTYIANYVFK